MKLPIIFYDARCGLCSRVHRLLAYVMLDFVPFALPESVRRCQAIGSLHVDQEIVVMADTVEMWQGAGAWVMCLWALQDYREWSRARRAVDAGRGTKDRASRL